MSNITLPTAPVTVAVTAPETTAAAATAITTSAEDKEVAVLADEVDSLKAANAPAKALIDATIEKMLDAKVRLLDAKVWLANAAKGIASTLTHQHYHHQHYHLPHHTNLEPHPPTTSHTEVYFYPCQTLPTPRS